jgi:MFS family permease
MLAAVSAAVLTLIRIPRPPAVPIGGKGRRLSEIARQPRFIIAVVCGVASYSMMNLIMTSAPLAMVECSLSITDATLGLQWHVIGMFLPSFFTGSLIARFGAERVIALGLALLLASGATGMAGTSLWHFWTALILLGLGWNFGFIGATTMVTQCHRPNERNRVQAFNDFLVFGSMAIGSFSSGKLLASFGWATVNEVIFPVVFIAAALLGANALRARFRPA